uniref:BspA family leucine-rich repeat surface protein n=1 Tax=Segatella copri TaxID=165179 RepID=UPI003563EF98
MKHFSNQSNGSHVGRMYNGGAIIRRFALFPLMLLMLLLLPANMVAETDYDTSVTLKELAGNPVGYKGETYANLFDGKKEDGNFSKWCCEFSGSAYVILEASKAGIPVGYIITTGNDNANPKCGGRNPLSWKLYGNNEGKEGAWTLIDKVENDKVLQDKNYASYNFDCKCSTSYQYFKWEISAIHRGSLLQVGEFELKLKTCTHLKADGSSALGAAIKTVEPTCTEHGYTTKECSLCHLIVKEYLNLKPHTLTHHALKAATCTETGLREYWQCSVCNKLFSNEAATTEITDAANLVIPANGHTLDSEGNCTVCGANRYALFNNLDGITDVTITDNGGYPWQILDSNAEGMQDLGFTIPKGSNGLMSGNYRVDSSSSETVIRFKVSKNILLTSQVIISSEEIGGDEWGDEFYIYVDDKFDLKMMGKKQTEYKVLLSPGEHSLKLRYRKDNSQYGNADRAFLYNLKTSVTMDDYVADYESSNNTLTFKKITSNNIESLDLNHAVIMNKPRVSNLCPLLGIDFTTIKSVVFDKSFETYAPTTLKRFFSSFKGLETIKDLKYLNTVNVTDMSHMFWACSALTSLDLSNFNTTHVTNMREMFYGCKKLTSLDLSNFITTNVTNMGGMFSSCSALTSLDLSNFYTKEVWYMDNMFNGCSALTTIYVSDKFVTVKVHYGGNMFKGCTNLNGYDYSETKFTYANYKTGYFTKLVGKNGDEKIGATGETLATDNLVLDDNKDFVAYEPFAAKAASYNRTMKEGTTWATLCLPFEVSLANQNFRAFKLLSADDVTETVELEEIEGSIAAGTPVIIKMKDGATKLNFTVADKEIAKDVQTAETANGNYQLQGLYTQKLFSKDTDNNCYIVKGAKLMNPAKLLDKTTTESVGSKPFRAYMVDNSSAPAAGARMFSISVGGSTTAIEQLETTADSKAEYYDLQGRRLQDLQKGINIVKRGGKTMKVIIK